MRRVGEELLLGGEGAVDPLEHGVEGVGEALQLVRRPAERDPPREVGGRDLLRGGRDPVHGPQQPARQQPAHEQRGEEEGRQRPERDLAQARESRVVHLALHVLLQRRVRIDEQDDLRERQPALLRVDDPLGDDVHGRRIRPERQPEVDAAVDEAGEREDDRRVERGHPEPDRAEGLGHASTRRR